MKTIASRIDAFLCRHFGARLTASIDREFRGHSITLRLWHENRPERARLHIATGGHFLHSYFRFGGEDTAVASLAIPGVAAWLSFDLPWTHPVSLFARKHDDRETGINVYLPDTDSGDLRVHWRVHVPSMSWSSSTPKWRDGSFNVSDAVLGRTVHAVERVVSEREVDVPMPERSYRWKVRIEEETWKRPRSPFTTRRLRAHCDALDGQQIPIPGKGENDYDCGDDAIYGSTFTARSVADAVGHIVASVTKTRMERGWEYLRGETPMGPKAGAA